LPVRQRRFLSLDMAHNFFTLEKWGGRFFEENTIEL
jgi:hypothetical protein